MKHLLKLLFFIIIFYSVINAQQLGFTIEGVVPKTDQGIDLGAAISLAAAYNVLPDFDIEGRIGYAAALKYLGWDLYLGSRYEVVDPVFITAGILNHSNDGWKSRTQGTVTNNITMLGLGSGVSFSPVFSMELVYYWLFKPVYWYSSIDFYEKKHKEYLNSVIRLNFKFLWNL